MKENLRFIISGGGTGGHIFPAVSIANAIKEFVEEHTGSFQIIQEPTIGT